MLYHGNSGFKILYNQQAFLLSESGIQLTSESGAFLETEAPAPPPPPPPPQLTTEGGIQLTDESGNILTGG